MNINSDQKIQSEHNYDECFEFVDGKGRVPDGDAIGFVSEDGKSLTLFSDIVFSKYDHKYWNNLELENDIDRVII